MARARNIKPGFFHNADLVELPVEARLLFIGLWTIADRAGRLEDRPKQIKMEVFPADSIDCDSLLSMIASTGMLVRYEVAGNRYLQITNFSKHQNPHRDEKASTIPDQYGTSSEDEQAQAKHDASTVQTPCSDDAGTVQIGLIPDSLLLNPEKDSSNPGVLLVVGKPTTIDCPQQEIIDLYATHLPELPFPRIWEGARAKNLQSRWKWVLADLKAKGKPHDKIDGLDFFARLFAYVSRSDFLSGRSGAWTACDLGWIVKAENFAKVIEGKYENREVA